MQRFLLGHVPGVILGFLIVAVGVVVSLIGLFLIRRIVGIATLEQHNEVAGFIIAVIGALYSVLLAFVMITVWNSTTLRRLTPPGKRISLMSST